MEYLRRIVHNLGHETESLLDPLPSIPAVVDYFELFAKYDTDFMEGIVEAIEYDGADSKHLRDFIAKYNLPWTVPEPIKPDKM